ncbi:hypothetical protein GMLC_02730 [Geomonas limicola]|uniref:Cytochrome c domain-containing protein n=1 Tax=Geomonas limicola TaxID=2740186 RepID=A0A6V8N3Y2_9BACT|nr:cytochrome c [Geomonas limicola]GFO66694.1 hypothetical protein GMLC_02730 [Geomonas limicola]
MAKIVWIVGGGLCLLLASAVATAWAEEGKELFQGKCSSCHSIGAGPGVGPDLKGVTARRSAEWLVRIITEPNKLTAEKDPTQTALVKQFGMEMPNLGVNREDAQRIVAFLGGVAAPAAAGAPEGAAGAGSGAETPTAAPPPAPVVPTPALLTKGRALFTGAARFAKGGAPCVSCHRLRYPGIEGGTLAADLTDIYTNMGDAGVRGVLQSLSFPVMKRVYADRPLAEGEAEPLIALFKDASARHAQASNSYPFIGLGFFVLFIVAAIVIRRRIR